MTANDSDLSKSPTFIFVGPTGYGLKNSLQQTQGLLVRPPAQRGDISELLSEINGSYVTIVIIDGRFGDVKAVGHRELLAAIRRGWQVWGLSSMGAIRAAELHSYGMIGFGRVYHHMLDTMAPDDEVAVLHEPGPDYRPVTEALVDLREFLGYLQLEGVLTKSQVSQVIGELSCQWFGDRTSRMLTDLCEGVAGPRASRCVRERLAELPRYRVKTMDLADFLEARPWMPSQLPQQ